MFLKNRIPILSVYLLHCCRLLSHLDSPCLTSYMSPWPYWFLNSNGASLFLAPNGPEFQNRLLKTIHPRICFKIIHKAYLCINLSNNIAKSNWHSKERNRILQMAFTVFNRNLFNT